MKPAPQPAAPREKRGIDIEISQIAGAQHGVISLVELMALGLSRSAIAHRCRAGKLHRKFKGAYAVGHQALSERGVWLAAVFAGGPGALLSHLSAARLWGVRIGEELPHVTAARSARGIKGLHLHRPRSLREEDRAEIDRIPVTSIARTLLDIAPLVGVDRLARIMDGIEDRHQPDWAPARSLSLSMTGHRGIGKFRKALELAVHFPEFTRSDFEKELLILCDEAGVKRPAMNHNILGYEVDAHWPGTRVIIELDTWATHGTPMRFERDKDRDIYLQLAGFQVFRLTPRRFTAFRQESIALLRREAPRL